MRNRQDLATKQPWTLVAGLAAGMLLASAVSAADPPAKPADNIHATVKAAVSRGEVEKTRQLGFTIEKNAFNDLPSWGAILIGFDVRLVKRFRDTESIQALRPLYLTADGEISNAQFGRFDDGDSKTAMRPAGRTVRVKARPGYAVARLNVRAGLSVHGMSVIFLRINGGALDPKEGYESEWLGETSGKVVTLTGKGNPIVGVFGNQDEEKVLAMGLIFADLSALPRPKLDNPAPSKPAAKAAEPVAGPAEADDPDDDPDGERADVPPKEEAKPAGNPLLLPLVVFAMVTIPVLLVLLVAFNRRGDSSPSARPRSTRPRRPAPPDRDERPPPNREHRAREDEEDLVEVLPNEPEPPAAAAVPPPLPAAPPAQQEEEFAPVVLEQPDPRSLVCADSPRISLAPPSPEPLVPLRKRGLFIECPRCRQKISTADRTPPWCPACGADFKSAAAQPRPAESQFAEPQPAALAPIAPPVPALREEGVSLQETPRDYDPPVERPSRRGRRRREEQPPFFSVRATFCFWPNRTYRVYILPKELLFIETGKEETERTNWTMFAWMAGGLVGALIAHAVMESTKNNKGRRNEIDEADLDELHYMADHGTNNFRVSAEDLADARIETKSLWHTIQYTTNSYEALMHFRHQQRGSYTLEFLQMNEMRMALEELPRVLGDQLAVNIVWDKQQHKYIRKS